ncbi:MAG: endolytic transglycosylase MltG [Bacteroidota bacterium]|nr:endolytic transglycosylase MltG [Bacteroidota bacterium]
MKTKKIILLLFGLVIIIAAYCAWQLFGPAVTPPESKFFYVHTGAGYLQVKNDLKRDNIIKGDFWLDKVARYGGYDKNVKPGKYKISEGMSIVSLIRMLRAGRQQPVNLVITKLRTKEDLARKIGNGFETDSISVIKFLNSNDSLLQFDVDTNSMMTMVIPNTYTFRWNTNLEKILKTLYNEDQKFWSTKRLQEAQRIGISPKEVYTLASIVEEETNKQDDKGKIASVYLNRKRKGMRLAADPTIKFAMKNFELKRIYTKYLSYPSPYNTYLNAGLPPGPICTPSMKTIDAVLNMPETDYLFFVARSDFSGYSDFATTYQEHLIYAKAYQQALDSLIRSKEENQ